MKEHRFKHRTRLVANIFTFVLALSSLLGNIKVFAAGQKAFTLSPMSQRIVLIPGETYHGSIKLSGPSTLDGEFRYLVTVGSYNTVGTSSSKDDYGDADFETISNMNAITGWIKIDNPTGVLTRDTTVEVTFSVNVPKDAPAGGQYASLQIRENPDVEYKDSNSGITQIMQMSHVIYADVAGETRRTGAITENNLPSFLTTNKLEATSMVRNSGNVHTDAEYMLQVWPMFSDEEICTNEEKTESSLILPNTNRYHVQTCDLPAVGIFRAKQVVKIFGEESTLEKTIIVCPIWLMVLILVIIVAIIIAIVVLIKRNKDRKSSKGSTRESIDSSAE